MFKIVYIADFFVDQIAGGAEICDDNLMKMLANERTLYLLFGVFQIKDIHQLSGKE